MGVNEEKAYYVLYESESGFFATSTLRPVKVKRGDNFVFFFW